MAQLLPDWLDRLWVHLGFSQFPYSVHLGKCLARHLKSSVSVGVTSHAAPRSQQDHPLVLAGSCHFQGSTVLMVPYAGWNPATTQGLKSEDSNHL